MGWTEIELVAPGGRDERVRQLGRPPRRQRVRQVQEGGGRREGEEGQLWAGRSRSQFLGRT